MTSRRAFLAGAGALAVSPLLPAIPAAGEVVTYAAPVIKTLDAAWWSGSAAISKATYHIYAVRTVTGALDMMAIPKGKRAPKGFQKLHKFGTLTRDENQNESLTQDTNKAS